MENTVEGLAEVYEGQSRQLLLVFSPEDIISNQKAQSFGRMVLTVPALMLSEFVLLSQEVIKLSQGILLSHFRRDRKKRDRPVVIGDLMGMVHLTRMQKLPFFTLGDICAAV